MTLRGWFLLACVLAASAQETPGAGIEEKIRSAEAGPLALVIPTAGKTAGEDRVFRDYANPLAGALAARGFVPLVHPVKSAAEFLRLLEAVGSSGRKAEVIVVFGHSGLDGPGFGLQKRGDPVSQMGPRLNTADFERMTELLRTAMEEHGLFFAFGCHTGGANRYETVLRSYPRWTRNVAERTKIYTVGVRGYGGMEGTLRGKNVFWLLRGLEFALEGGRQSQELDVTGPGGADVPSNFNWLRDRNRTRSESGRE